MNQYRIVTAKSVWNAPIHLLLNDQISWPSYHFYRLSMTLTLVHISCLISAITRCWVAHSIRAASEWHVSSPLRTSFRRFTDYFLLHNWPWRWRVPVQYVCMESFQHVVVVVFAFLPDSVGLMCYIYSGCFRSLHTFFPFSTQSHGVWQRKNEFTIFFLCFVLFCAVFLYIFWRLTTIVQFKSNWLGITCSWTCKLSGVNEKKTQEIANETKRRD